MEGKECTCNTPSTFLVQPRIINQFCPATKLVLCHVSISQLFMY